MTKEVTEVKNRRCPRCGATLITDGDRVWCTFVGGGNQKACAYGIDAPVSAHDITARLQSAMHLRSAAIAPQTDETIELMREAQGEIERLRAKVQSQCAHLFREHHTGGWTCSTCGARGTPKS